eukprot:10969336-Prorocentrum_lima.AAC.1
MTSSLVGSEMCIRDRPPPKKEVMPMGMAVAPHHLGVERFIVDTGCGYNPVSYTHLTLPTICSV